MKSEKRISLNDRTLVRRLGSDTPEVRNTALEALYGRYADLLFAFICHRVCEHLDAEEIWQETWVAAIRSIEKYRGKSNFFTWLCGIARHKIADHFRRAGTGNNRYSDIPAEDVSDVRTVPPDEALEQAEINMRVIETMASIRDEYRTALIARYIDDCCVEDIAERLGKSYKAAESTLSRARASFRIAFDRTEKGNGRKQKS